MKSIIAFPCMCIAAQSAGTGSVVRAGLPLALVAMLGLIALRRRSVIGSTR